MRLVLMSKLLGIKKMMSMLLVAWVAFALAASPQVNSDSVQLSQKLGDGDGNGDKDLGSGSFRSLKLADGDLLRYRMDWQRGIITLMAEAKPQSALKVDFAATMSQAWEQGLSDFYQLSRYLYHEYYGEFPVVSSGPTERTRAQTASFESEKNRAADRASRHVFSSLSQFRSDGSVGLHLSARLAAVLSDVRVGGDAPQLSDKQQEGGGVVVAFRFLCAVQPLPYLVVRYGGEEVYAPSLMSRAAYEQQLMGTWLQDTSYDIRSYLERIWQRSTAFRPKRWLQLALQCSDDSRTFDGVSSAEWESLSAEDKRRWAWSGRSFFLW